jgi:hypothetical protein
LTQEEIKSISALDVNIRFNDPVDVSSLTSNLHNRHTQWIAVP